MDERIKKALDRLRRETERESSDDELLAAEVARLQGLLAEETEAEQELARLELEYHSVQQAVADATHRLTEARDQLARVDAEVDSVHAQHADKLRRIDRAAAEESERIDKAMGNVLRLTSARATAEAQVEALRLHLDELRAEQMEHNERILEVSRAIAEAKATRAGLEGRLREIEAATASERILLAEIQGRADRAHAQAERQLARIAPEPQVTGGEEALAEAAAVLDAAAADLAVQSGEDPRGFDPFARRRSLVNASWNGAFALLSVLVMLLGVKALTDDPTPTEAFCAEAPVLDVAAARQALSALGAGARPGTAFSTFEQGRYAYTTTSRVDDDVRRAAADLEAAHAAVAEQKSARRTPAELDALGAAVFDADAALRAECASFLD